PIPRKTNDGSAGLSFAQEGLWFLDQMEPGNAAYNIPMAFRLVGPLDVVLLERALNEVIRRHQILRTTFPLRGEQPIQLIAPSLTVALPIVDLQTLPKTLREAEVLRLAVEEAQQTFDLNRGPLIRSTLLRLGAEEHVWLLTMHHIISDGWSMGVLFREITLLYEAFSKGATSPLPDLALQYADFALWQRQWLQGEALEAQLVYWKQQLAGAPQLLELPADRPRPSVQTYRGARQSL